MEQIQEMKDKGNAEHVFTRGIMTGVAEEKVAGGCARYIMSGYLKRLMVISIKILLFTICQVRMQIALTFQMPKIHENWKA